jgi:tetratricopeptide (TPR) repeat protein
LRKLVSEALAEDPELPRALLHRVQLDVALERPDEAKQTLERLLSRDDLSPRDQSLAAIFHARYVQKASHLSELIQAHLVRFPHDLDARLELLRERFRAAGSARLLAAVDFADEVLETAPNAAQAASKLVRALTWMGRPDDARARLRAHGIEPGDKDAPRATDFVFAELDLYSGRYDEARRAFESIREPDGDLTYYAANMRLAALMLDGRCDEAVEGGAFLLRNAASPKGELGVDWTYLLSVNALMCAGRPADAFDAVLEWPQRTNGTSGSSSYQSISQLARVLIDPDPAGIAQELIDYNEDYGSTYSLDFIITFFARDPASLTRHILAIRKSQHGGGGTFGIQVRARMLRALEARERFLQGDVETALDAFARLAFFADHEMVNEGDVYERIRWMGVYASHLEEAGHVELAREVWHALRASGFGRVLSMEMTYLADVRLGRLK